MDYLFPLDGSSFSVMSIAGGVLNNDVLSIYYKSIP